MIRRVLVAVLLLLASSLALAADLQIDTIAGVYKFSHRLWQVDGPGYQAEDVLEIVRVGPRKAYVRTQLYFNNGHECSLNGLASVLGDNLILKQVDDPSGDVCELMLSVEGGRIVFHDKDNMCMMHNCGMRGSFEGTHFALSSRRTIRYMQRLLASREYRTALAPEVAEPPSPAVKVEPMHFDGSLPRFPRLIAFPDARVRQKVNAALAANERSAREDREGCFDLIRDAGRRPSDANFRLVIDVRYISERYLSLAAFRSYDCAGPYPTDNMPEPMTFDLTTGDALNWAKVFKPGFLPGETGGDAMPGLHAMYVAKYRREGGAADPECKRVVAESPGPLVLRLDAQKGLAVQPDYPHVMAACADELFFSPDEIAPYVQDAKFLTDLRATVHR